MNADLDVYVESLANFRGSGVYLIKVAAARLGDAGIRVRFLDRMPRSGLAPAAFVHVDLTVVPRAFHAVQSSYRRTINGRALSVHRHLYSTLRLQQGEAHPGPVIVKTVLNSHGRPELRLQKYKSSLSRARYTLNKLLVPGYKQRAAPPYRIYQSTGEVPDVVWHDARLIVERFAFDRLDLPIVKHRCVFLLDTAVNLRQTFSDILCASGSHLKMEDAGQTPDAVTEVRQRLNLDFGAIDYFVVNGKAIVIDVNKTIGSSAAYAARYPFRGAYNEKLFARLVEFVRG